LGNLLFHHFYHFCPQKNVSPSKNDGNDEKLNSPNSIRVKRGMFMGGSNQAKTRSFENDLCLQTGSKFWT
jgi:hypothetical protein